jgi:hypothetical protein
LLEEKKQKFLKQNERRDMVSIPHLSPHSWSQLSSNFDRNSLAQIHDCIIGQLAKRQECAQQEFAQHFTTLASVIDDSHQKIMQKMYCGVISINLANSDY